MACKSEIDTPPPLPGEIPVMVLPDCHLFPGCLLPLYIFEERYRKMLDHLLGSNRIFCIGNRTGDGDTDISPCSTAGLVRACVRQDDGTSHLLLLGLQRIRFTGWLQQRPFPIATIEPIVSIQGDYEQTRLLKDRVLDLFSQHGETASQLRDTLAESEDLELVADVLSYHFTRCPTLQQKLLGEANVQRRFEMIIEALEKHKPSAK